MGKILKYVFAVGIMVVCYGVTYAGQSDKTVKGGKDMGNSESKSEFNDQVSIFLELTSSDTTFKLKINGKSVNGASSDGKYTNLGVPINEYLKVGKNLFEFEISSANQSSSFIEMLLRNHQREIIKTEISLDEKIFSHTLTVEEGLILAKQQSIFSSGMSRKEAEQKKQIFMLEADAKNCRAEVYFNDIPMFMLDGYKDSNSINQRVIEGENVITVVLNPGPTPSLARSAEKKAVDAKGIEVNLKVVRYPEGVFPGDPSGKLFCKLNWAGKEGETIKVPLELQAKFNPGKWKGEWNWQKGEKLEMNESLIREISGIVRQIYDEEAKKNFVLLSDMYKFNFQDGIKAFDWTDEDINNYKGKKEKNSDERIAAKNWGLEPLDMDKLDFRLIAGGKIIECLGKDWGPAFESKGYDSISMFNGKEEVVQSQLSYTFKFAKIKGKWYQFN